MHLTVTIDIDMDNAAFGRNASSRLQEAQRMVMQWVKHDLPYGRHQADDGKFRDYNGNTCGTWTLTITDK